MARRTKPVSVLSILPAQCAELGIDASTPSQTDTWGVSYIVGKGRGRKVYRIEWDNMPITDYTIHGAVYGAPF